MLSMYSRVAGPVPPPLEAKDCSVSGPANERPYDRFVRKGGQRTKVNVIAEGKHLTVPGVTQARNLGQYETLELRNPRPMTVIEMKIDPILGQARTFLWNHWKDRKNAYLILTYSSIDATSTSHVFVEQGDDGRWRVSWRSVRWNGWLDDSPTSYSVRWVIPAGFRKPGIPVPSGQMPDPLGNKLEFQDACGDIEGTF